MQELIRCINAYVNKETLNKPEDDSGLLKLSIEQALQTLLYPVYKDNKYKKYYIEWVIKQEKFYNLQEEITSIFNINNIDHLFFKGSIISKLYDDPSTRTRGDIDIYVNINKFEEAKKLLIDNGYVLDSDNNDNTHHIGLYKNNLEIELHFNLFDNDSDKKWLETFKDPFIHSNKINGNLYELNDTYHFLYCLMHFAHHLRYGAGIRYILDFYYMLSKTNIDYELLHKLLEYNKLCILYENIINTIRLIFNNDYDNKISNKEIDFFIDYLLLHGVHGFVGNDTERPSTHSNKLRYMISRVFMTNKNYRISRYPHIGKHWYTYPICLIVHILYLLTHKLKQFFKFVFARNKNKELYDKLGV